MDILSLRTELETTLVDVLGTYRLANGVTTPAIAVRATGESLPPGTTVSGLECVIVKDPDLVPIRQYRQEHAFSRWTLYLVLWDNADVSLQDVGGRLIWAYPGSNVVSITIPKGVGPRHQMRVELQTNPDRIEGN
jgi:hypothetical protein